jgi:hypothetical protein
MKALQPILLLIGITSSITAAADPPTFPSLSYSEDRRAVFLQSFTDNDVRYECNYALTATHDDGTPEGESGVTDPPTGGQPTTVVIVNYGEPVRSASITVWQCFPISTPAISAKDRPIPIHNMPCDGTACQDISWSHTNIAIFAKNDGAKHVHVRFASADCILKSHESCGSFGLVIPGTPQADYASDVRADFAPKPGPKTALSPPANSADSFACAPPYGPKIPPSAYRIPYAFQTNISPGQKAELCVTAPRSAVLESTDCHRLELIFDKYPKWDCPLDKPCDGRSEFQRGRRESLDDRQDKFCVTFLNGSSVAQDAGVNFHFKK